MKVAKIKMPRPMRCVVTRLDRLSNERKRGSLCAIAWPGFSKEEGKAKKMSKNNIGFFFAY